MGKILDTLTLKGFAVVSHGYRGEMPKDAPVYRPNDEKLIGEGIHIPPNVRQELGLK